MKLSLNWLSKFIDIKDLSTEEIMDKAVKAGFEVEDVVKIGQGTNLVVGKVLTCTDHPDSDHLHLTTVDVGDEVLNIVCGAPNCRAGLKVIVAKDGAVLPGGTIKKGVIRGQESNGMLCSLLELGVDKELLDDDSCSFTGIEELDDSFEIGDTDILAKLGYDDTILDMSIYANRPDCLAMFYMAKEMGAILRRPCVLPEFKGASDIGDDTNFKLEIDSKNCPHFLAKVINSVTIKESPDWIKEILKSNGIKCINNLVDISNLVMLETGQPMHFYDLRSNPNRNITVKDDYEGEYIALDGITYNIEKGDLMITSDGNPIGIAGIMGGDATKILDDTSSIIVESACFDHAQIRRTSNRLGLQTEAAARYSKGLEPLAQIKAMDRAIELLIKYADAKDLEKTVEAGSDNYSPVVVEETLTHLNTLIGKKYEMKEVEEVIKALDFGFESEKENFKCFIPSYRTDILIREDIDEEICRLTDFDDLKSTLPYMPQTVGRLTTAQVMRRTIRNYFMYNGLSEVRTYTLVSDNYKDNALLKNGEAVKLLSPLSEDRKYIRTSLMSSMLETLSYNLGHYNSNVNIYELSSVYFDDHAEERLGVVLNGTYLNSEIKHVEMKADFYVLKGLVMGLLDKLGFEKGRVQVVENTEDDVHFHPGISCLIKMNNKTIGILGKLHPTFEGKLKLKDTYYCELVLNELINSKPSKTHAPIVNKYPSISRDISIVLSEDIKADELIKVIKKAGGALVKSIKVFDIYKGEHIADGFKSVSLNIVYEDNSKTLKASDIDVPHNKILEELNKKYNANQR